MIVADTNLVAYLSIEGDVTANAREVWKRDAEWRMPPLWRSEFLNVLTVSVKASVLTREQATATWDVASLLFGQCELEPEGVQVLWTAMRYGVSAYDAHFVAVAEELGVPLVTGDRRVLEACSQLAISIQDFAAGRSLDA